MGTKKAVATREVSDEELAGAVRELVQRASGIAGSELKKELDAPYKKLGKRALELAGGLAAHGEIHRWVSAKKERFFATDYIETLSKAVKQTLAFGPLEEPELKLRLDKAGRGLGDVFKTWVKTAVGRGELFVHPAKAGTKKKLGLHPPDVDVRVAFKPVFTALTNALKKNQPLTPRSKAALLAEFAKDLGLEPAASAPSPQSAPSPRADGHVSEEVRSSFIRALEELSAENVANGLLPIRDLRARLRLDKESFDRLSLELSRAGVVTLHHHDFPTSLSPSERMDMVEDERGTHYVGIALRRNHG